MWLYLFIILAIGSVQSLTIGYPLRTFLAYEPTGRTPGRTTAAQGFLVYLDNSGIERIVGYNYAQPVYAIHQISYINREASNPQTFEQAESSEVVKAQEAHFRAWSLQQYQVLKREIDLLRGEGKEPSSEMLLKFLPLEKIALTSDYSKIAELPEVKKIREEHLNIWQQVPQLDEDQLEVNIKSNIEKSNTTLADIEVTLVQRLANLKQLEMQKQYAQNDNTKSIIRDKSAIDQLSSTEAVNERENVKPKVGFAFKVSSESEIERDLSSDAEINSQSEGMKLSSIPSKLDNDKEIKRTQSDLETLIPSVALIEKEDLKVSTETEQKLKINREISKKQSVIENPFSLVSLIEVDEHTNSTETKQKHQMFEETNNKKLSKVHLKPDTDQTFVRVQPLQVLDTPEVVKAREEHLSLKMQAKQKINGQKKIQSELQKLITSAPNIYVPQQVVDTAEVMRARDEHLRIVNEAIKKIKIAQGGEQ